MDVDFDAAAKRFSKDQASRKEALAAKREQQAKEREAMRRKKEKWEAEFCVQ